ncbi:GIY-YIG nuclease family protein [Microdochium nivale]|nr:GIY-YIG nuclease family protein [Microdochium nivale]
MRYTPSVHKFVSVYDLDPAGRDKCIYFTQQQAAGYPRCSLHRRRDDQDQARVLLGRLDTTQAEAPDLETIKALVRLCCCVRAKHRAAIERDGLLVALSERWLDEVRERRRARDTISDDDKILLFPSSPQATGLISPPPTPPRRADRSTPRKRLDPEVSDFIAFDELDPLHHKRCIYKKQDGQDCPFECADEDNARARELHRDISSRATRRDDLRLLQALALYSCCGPAPGGTRHQDRIEYKGLLLRLAERWLGEITQQREAGLRLQALQASDKGASPTTATTTITRTTTESTLRSGKPIRPFSSGRPWKSTHFRRHIDEPSETVASKIQQPLSDADARPGRLYIFTRPSSRGYVKIGYTSGAVQDRLDQWAKCGYTPELVYSTGEMGNVRRAETLVHYELARRWRAERGCHACDKSHKEWFRVAAEQAVQVVRGWEQVMRHAGLYGDGSGSGSRVSLADGWARVVEGMAEHGTCVTATRLLEVHQWLQTVGGCMPGLGAEAASTPGGMGVGRE